jgi:uncharacterized protein
VSTPFWQNISLEEMSRPQWESLCDGCAKCCLIKLEDPDSGELAFTDVVCRYLNTNQCQCTCYVERKTLVPDCLVLTPDQLTPENLKWFPSTCAYRLLAENKPLPWWHPLISDDKESVYQAGTSVRYRVISETQVDEENIEQRIVTWPE